MAFDPTQSEENLNRSFSNSDHHSFADSYQDSLIASINITPFVDVVLVLLVIFMITTPALIKSTLPIQIPQSSQGEPTEAQRNVLGIVITASGQTLLEGKLLDLETLKTEILTRKNQQPNLSAIIAADENTKHGDIIKIMSLLKETGVSRFAFETQKPTSSP
jgi:biopolymer transport protein ExbD